MKWYVDLFEVQGFIACVVRRTPGYQQPEFPVALLPCRTAGVVLMCVSQEDVLDLRKKRSWPASKRHVEVAWIKYSDIVYTIRLFYP